MIGQRGVLSLGSRASQAFAAMIVGVVAATALAAATDEVPGRPLWLDFGMAVVAGLVAAVGILFRSMQGQVKASQEFVEKQLESSTQQLEQERQARKETTAAFLTNLREVSQGERTAHQHEIAALLDRLEKRDEIVHRQTETLLALSRRVRGEGRG